MKFILDPQRRRLLKALAAARGRVGVTQPQLADKVGSSRNFIRKYESGGRQPPKARVKL
jgi:transcriptional regulator with XRE-family HTH domain